MSFTVSIDAATAETYALVRGGNWEELQLGINRYQKNIQHFTFVVQEKNWHEIELIAEYADQLGKRVDYQKFLDWGHWTNNWWHENNPLDRHKDHYLAVLGALNQVRQRYPKCTFSTEIINLMNKVK
jgi:MoaA/NifB/PqqE/SkfB family radical SAM enzyme